MRWLLFLCLLGSIPATVPAQVAHSIELSARLLYGTTPEDSLPSNMPLIKRVFWGKQGLFRLTGIAPRYRRDELRLRQRMLQWHQRLGLITLAGMITQFTTGILIYDNPTKYYERWRPVHRALGYGLLGLYLTTASFSTLAPPARIYRPGFSSIKLHQYLALIHFPGMLLQPYLGYKTATARTSGDYNFYRTWHRRVGFITTAAFSLAVLSIFLPY